MKKTITRIAVFSLLAAAIAVAPSQAFAQATKESKAKKDKPPASEPAEKAAKKQGVIPFHGKIAAVDKTAKTIKVGERTFQVTSETRIKKAGKDATLADAPVGEEVGGAYRKADGGKLLLRSLRIGPKPEAKGEPKKEGAKKDGKNVNKP